MNVFMFSVLTSQRKCEHVNLWNIISIVHILCKVYCTVGYFTVILEIIKAFVAGPSDCLETSYRHNQHYLKIKMKVNVNKNKFSI